MSGSDDSYGGHVAFTRLRDHPRMAVAIGSGADGDARRGPLQAWHQDTTSAEPGQFIVNRLVSLWDVEPDSGEVMCVPGSHRSGRIPSGDPQGSIAGEVAFAPRAGPLILMHWRCYHRVKPNRSVLNRVSINFRIRPAGAAQQLDSTAAYRTGTHDFVNQATADVETDGQTKKRVD